MTRRPLRSTLALGLLLAATATPTLAAPAPVTLVLKDHRFTPAQFTIPAGQRVQIVLINQDKATEEFDSHDLRIEKLVTPGGKVSFWIGPVAAGVYSFMGEFHPATAQGRVTAVNGR